MAEEVNINDSSSPRDEKKTGKMKRCDVEQEGPDGKTEVSQETKDNQPATLETSADDSTTPISNQSQNAGGSETDSPATKKRPRGRPRSSLKGSKKKAVTSNKNIKTEKTQTVQSEDGLPAKDGAVNAAETPPAKTEQTVHKIGRIIKKPKIFSPDFEMTTPKKKIRRGRRSQAESVSETDTPDSSGDTAIKKRENVNPKWLIPFQHGWRREIVLRGTCGEKKARQSDVYYYSPHGGPKLRSIPEICRHLRETNSKVTSDCFTFIKELIHEEPSEVLRLASKYKKPIQKSSASQKKGTSISATETVQETDLNQLKSEPKSDLQTPEGGMAVLDDGSKAAEVGSTANVQSEASSASEKSLSIPVKLNSEASECNEVKQVSSDVKRAVKHTVAKKHTAKRPHSLNEEKVTNGSVGNTAKKLKTGGEQRLCGMDCPGRHGVPPSLHCNVCMCMFHPECIGKQSLQRFDGFVCKACKVMNKKLRDLPPSASVPLPGPPPLHVSPSPNSNLNCGPPPLRAAPNAAGGFEGLRAPPPLRMAPVSSLPPVVPSPVSLSSVVRLPTMQIPSLVPNMGNSQPMSMLAPVNLSTAITAPNIAPVPSDLMLSMPAPAPIPLTVPTVVPKDVSGQILSLPKNIADKLNLGKPVSIKVNQHNFVIPANCFMKTKDGAKVYLPDGYLPENFTQGPSSPLNFTLSDSLENCGQVIDVRTCSSRISEDLPESQPQLRKSQRLSTSKCYIKNLHVGFDCMLLIFQYLELKDLLRAHQVCKTWKRVAAHKYLWRRISFRGCNILDWEKAAKKLSEMHTKRLDLRGVKIDKESLWSHFIAVLPSLTCLQHIDFGHCPGSLLHSVTDKLQNLEGLTAEFIADTLQEPDMWSVPVKLDIGKFSRLTELRVLKLRGVCGLMLPSLSFNGGLSDLGSLRKLKALSLTTLRDIPEYEFSFLGSLTELEELELGDIKHWKSETYKQIAKLSKLRSLRLECGTDFDEYGLGEALLSLEKLHNLELMKFTASGSLIKNLSSVKSLKTLSIWPDTETQEPAVVNTRTLRAVSDMKSLTRLEWGIMVEQASSSGTADSTDSNDVSAGGKETCDSADDIPFLPANVDLSKVEEDKEHLDDIVEHLTVCQLVNRLSDFLPDTKIHVFKVPIISVSKS